MVESAIADFPEPNCFRAQPDDLTKPSSSGCKFGFPEGDAKHAGYLVLPPVVDINKDDTVSGMTKTPLPKA